MVKKSSKGVQTKAETLTVRLSPKVKYGLELLARKQRRNLSNVIEWAIDQALKTEEAVSIGATKLPNPDDQLDFFNEESEPSMNDVINEVWSSGEHTRLVRLAFMYPLLLTYEEEVVWNIICRLNFFWLVFDENGKEVLPRNIHTINMFAVGQMWPYLKQIMENQMDKSEFKDVPEDHPDRELIAMLMKINESVRPQLEESKAIGEEEPADPKEAFKLPTLKERSRGKHNKPIEPVRPPQNGA